MAKDIKGWPFYGLRETSVSIGIDWDYKKKIGIVWQYLLLVVLWQSGPLLGNHAVC